MFSIYLLHQYSGSDIISSDNKQIRLYKPFIPTVLYNRSYSFSTFCTYTISMYVLYSKHVFLFYMSQPIAPCALLLYRGVFCLYGIRFYFLYKHLV